MIPIVGGGKMKVNRSILLTCLAMLAIVAGALGKEAFERWQKKSVPLRTEQNVAPTTTSQLNFPVIGYLENRSEVITLKAGPNGPLYSGRSNQGKNLFENLSIEQLRAQAPEIHQLITAAVASGPGKSSVIIDARVRNMSNQSQAGFAQKISAR
jgi:hypothetical protein